MTRDHIRDLIDQLGVPSRIDDDGDLLVEFTADSDFGHNVSVWIIISDNGCNLTFIGSAAGFRPQGDILFMVNRSNERRNYPTAVLRGDEVRFEYSFYISEEVSDEYLKDSIRLILSSMWSGFRDFEKESISD